MRVSIFVGQTGLKPGPHTCLQQYGKLAQYAATLCDSLLLRLLQWKPIGQRRVFFSSSPRSFFAARKFSGAGLFTGQPSGTYCVYTGQSPDVLLVGKV